MSIQIVYIFIYVHLEVDTLLMGIGKQCVAVDANTEFDLVAALKVSGFPEILFTKAGKILYREKGRVLYSSIL